MSVLTDSELLAEGALLEQVLLLVQKLDHCCGCKKRNRCGQSGRNRRERRHREGFDLAHPASIKGDGYQVVQSMHLERPTSRQREKRKW